MQIESQSITRRDMRISNLLLLLIHLILVSYTPSEGAGIGHRSYVDTSLRSSHLLHAATQGVAGHSFELFSHGRSGELFIGGQWLDAPSIVEWWHEQGVDPQIDQLNIYGCNFASGELGRAAHAYLEDALCLSVSASDDITGASGDWILEVGGIDAYGPLEIDYPHDLLLNSLWSRLIQRWSRFWTSKEVAKASMSSVMSAESSCEMVLKNRTIKFDNFKSDEKRTIKKAYVSQV